MNGLDINFIIARVVSVGMYNSGTTPVLTNTFAMIFKTKDFEGSYLIGL